MNSYIIRVGASKIIEEKRIRLKKKDSFSFLFNIENEDKPTTEVYYYFDKKENKWIYNCNNLTKNKKWSCSLFVGDKSKPYCKHTLAVYYYLEELKKIRY